MLFSALDDAKFARIFIVDSNSVSFSRVEQLHGQVYNNEINFLALLALFKSHPTWFVEVANVSKYFFYLPTYSTYLPAQPNSLQPRSQAILWFSNVIQKYPVQN